MWSRSLLNPLPDYRDTVIVVGTSCRKPLNILAPHLESLAYQELPPRTRLHFVYVPDFVNGQEDAQEALLRFVNERGGELIKGLDSRADDFSDAPQHDSHQWTGSAMARVGAHKNLIIKRALELKADYLFLCDADLILDRTTIASLLAAQKPITTAVYWSYWTKRGTETRKIHAAPQVWLRHPYQLDGRGMDEAEFRQKLLSRSLTRVYGFGACTLIDRRVLEAGVSFEYLPDVPQQGLMAGEDRHFCIRAERMHIEAYADPFPDIFHVYHADQDIPRIPEMLKRLGAVHPQKAQLGDLVSLRLRALEPVPVGPNQYQQPMPLSVRGRLGQLAMLPELEEAVYGLSRNDRAVIRCHFPVHHSMPFLRGATRLIEVSLVDCKPFCFSPQVEDEMYVGPRSGAWHDQVTLNVEQNMSIQEVGGAA